MLVKLFPRLLLSFLFISFQLCIQAQKSPIQQWLTLPNRSALLERQKDLRFENNMVFEKLHPKNLPFIQISSQVKFQSIDGFGFALTGGSAMHIIRMNKERRAALLQELFGNKPGNIAVSYLRLSIGASDLNEKVFSYDDLPAGETDPELKKFDLGPDRADVIPVMKEILRINPKIKILGSPWSPPTWMKNNKDTRGGRLLPEFYPAYAQYFVKYIQGMKKEGITIDAVTVQNEPLHPGNNPSLLMPAPDQADFIKNHLGPAFSKAGIKTKIILYDHNADRPDYPIFILNDTAASKYIDGSAFHFYGGEMKALKDVRNAHPDKKIYFSEQMVVQDNKDPLNIGSPLKWVVIDALRNYSRNVLLWNLAADPENKPYTDRGGCSMCQGAVTIDGNSVSRNLAYYTIAHVSRFVPPGSIRTQSAGTDSLAHVSFLTPDGRTVLIVVNNNQNKVDFAISQSGLTAFASMEAGAACTYIWR